MQRLRPLLLVPVFAAVLAAGCGGGNPLAPAAISGSVNFKGKPLTGGTVMFCPVNGAPYAATIGADGTYSISDVPVGELVVCVETESINPVHKEAGGKEAQMRQAQMGDRKPPAGQGGGSSGTGGAQGTYTKIPEKYAKPKTSPLTYTVKNGRNVHTVELE